MWSQVEATRQSWSALRLKCLSCYKGWHFLMSNRFPCLILKCTTRCTLIHRGKGWSEERWEAETVVLCLQRYKNNDKMVRHPHTFSDCIWVIQIQTIDTTIINNTLFYENYLDMFLIAFSFFFFFHTYFGNLVNNSILTYAGFFKKIFKSDDELLFHIYF